LVQKSNVLTFLSFFSKLRVLLRPKAGVERVELAPSLLSGCVKPGKLTSLVRVGVAVVAELSEKALAV